MPPDTWFCGASVMIEHEHPNGSCSRQWFRCQLPPDHARLGLGDGHKVRVIDATIVWSDGLLRPRTDR
jgi:hypothetical protein